MTAKDSSEQASAGVSGRMLRVASWSAVICVLLIELTMMAAGAAQTDSSRRRETSITGRLVDGSGQPIPNASIHVRKVGVASAGRALGTDSEGRFHADDLAQGTYTVVPTYPGYVLESATGEPQYYRPGDNVTFRMVKGAVISGTVTNSSGDPVVAARVSAIRVRDAEGRLIRGAGLGSMSRQTDDRGAYRLYGLEAGSYLVVVNGGSLTYFPATAYDGDAPTYYPSTTRDAASEVVVHTGDEISGIDIRYRGERGHIISGTFSGSFGSDSTSRTVTMNLTHASSGAVEANTFISLSSGERGFALYGVPDGEYDLQGISDVTGENAAASLPRRVVVRGADVTGIDVALAPLGSVAGRVVLVGLPESERKPDCKEKRAPRLDETVIVARRDMTGKGPSISTLLMPRESPTDDKGEFKIYGLFAGTYRIEPRLPSETWYVRSIVASASGPSSKRGVDAAMSGLAIGAGQRASDVIVTIAEGAGAIRGKVAPASAGASLPARLRVHLVPAEPEAAEAVVRFYEAVVESDNTFSITNVAPGRYFILPRPVPDEEVMERTPRPAAWDARPRASLRTEAQAANNAVEIQACQRLSDYVLKYTSPARLNR